jgi:hypothetical protein
MELAIHIIIVAISNRSIRALASFMLTASAPRFPECKVHMNPVVVLFSFPCHTTNPMCAIDISW